MRIAFDISNMDKSEINSDVLSYIALISNRIISSNSKYQVFIITNVLSTKDIKNSLHSEFNLNPKIEVLAWLTPEIASPSTFNSISEIEALFHIDFIERVQADIIIATPFNFLRFHCDTNNSVKAKWVLLYNESWSSSSNLTDLESFIKIESTNIACIITTSDLSKSKLISAFNKEIDIFTLPPCTKKEAYNYTHINTKFSELHRFLESIQNQSSTNYSWLDRTYATDTLISKLSMLPLIVDKHGLSKVSKTIDTNINRTPERQIFVDISEICRSDANTGVQRVVRKILLLLLNSPPAGYRVEPVYASADTPYKYARIFTHKILQLINNSVTEECIRFDKGDIFFALDMQHHVQIAQRDYFQFLRNQGVKVKFMVYDLLPINFPEFFKGVNTSELHESLMEVVLDSNEAICISKSTANSLKQFAESKGVDAADQPILSWIPLGSDIHDGNRRALLPSQYETTIERIKNKMSFLVVSTIEPRKMHKQIIEAFEILWSGGLDINLVFLGKEGWGIEDLKPKLFAHKKSNKNFIWLNKADDILLEQAYMNSTCLISASIDEGFGLPIVESANYNLPCIVRNIPVFREVAKENAYYFDGFEPENLNKAILDWVSLYKKGGHPKPQKYICSWEESTKNLIKKLLT
jgi:glycosyltransferase involved in cell wall biosynthesis